MFELLAGAIIAATLFGGVAVDDELYRTINTLANLATVALLVWHQRHVKRQIEPEVKEAAAVIKRELGTREPGSDPADDCPRRRKDD